MKYWDAIGMLTWGDERMAVQVSTPQREEAIMRQTDGEIKLVNLRDATLSDYNHAGMNNDNWALAHVSNDAGVIHFRHLTVSSNLTDAIKCHPDSKLYRRLSWDLDVWLDPAKGLRSDDSLMGWEPYDLATSEALAEDWVAKTQYTSEHAPGIEYTVGQRMVGFHKKTGLTNDQLVGKERIASVITMLHDMRVASSSPEQCRLLSVAITKLEEADLWVTKALGVFDDA